jgi:hypothetical protein
LRGELPQIILSYPNGMRERVETRVIISPNGVIDNRY